MRRDVTLQKSFHAVSCRSCVLQYVMLSCIDSECHRVSHSVIICVWTASVTKCHTECHYLCVDSECHIVSHRMSLTVCGQRVSQSVAQSVISYVLTASVIS